MSFDERLDQSEANFILGYFRASLEQSHQILTDLLAHYRENTYGRTRFLNEMMHVCPRGCVCRAAFALCLQSLYELRETDKVADLTAKFFHTVDRLPFELFVLWLDLHIALSEYKLVVEAITMRLERDKARTTGFKSLTAEEYAGLLELLVFHALLPLGAHRQAFHVLRNNNKLYEWKREAFLSALQQQVGGDLLDPPFAAAGVDAAAATAVAPLPTPPYTPTEQTRQPHKLYTLLRFLYTFRHAFVTGMIVAFFFLRTFDLRRTLRNWGTSWAMLRLVLSNLGSNLHQLFVQSNMGRMVSDLP
eukprot:g13559.t1